MKILFFNFFVCFFVFVLSLFFTVNLTWASSFKSQDSVVPVDKTLILSLNLLDSAGDPVLFKKIKLIPSSNNVRLLSVSNGGFTDENGMITFKVKGSVEETVTFSLFDSTEDKILPLKETVLFLNDKNEGFLNLFNNDFALSSDSVDSFGEVRTLKFENFNSTPKVGEVLSFTVSALSSENRRVSSYLGQIEFLITEGDANYVNLPNDYRFSVDDLGRHVFNLALSFQRAGRYKVLVRDKENTAILGEAVFTVGSANQSPIVDSTKPVILNPLPGTYVNNTTVISGLATPLSTLKIFNGNKEFTTLKADNAGKFSFTSPQLVQGDHLFSVAEIDALGNLKATSDPVKINVNSAAPQILNFKITPNNIVAGENFRIALSSSKSLSLASVLLDGNVYPLKKNLDNSLYEVDLKAPEKFGEYPLLVSLVDDLGNTATFPDTYKVRVGGQLTLQSTGKMLGEVTSLKARGEDGRVVLTWTPPVDAKNGVFFYRVYYGTSVDDLSTVVDTFTNAPTWYIPGLLNGITYYFAVVAVDTKGNSSQYLSNLATATPGNSLGVLSVEPIDVGYDFAGGENIQYLNSDVSSTGPSVVFLFLLAFLSGGLYVFLSKFSENNYVE